MNSAALNRVVGFALGALPDSLSQRKAILKDLLAVIHPRHKLRGPVVEMLTFLEAHEQHQLELSLDFKAENPLTQIATQKKGKSK